MPEEQDPLSGGKEISSQAITFGKVGDFIKGTYTGKKVVDTSNGEAPLFELKAIMGRYHNVDDKKNPIEPELSVEKGEYYNVWGSFKTTSGAYSITSLFKKVPFGEIVAIRLKEEIPSKTKGNAPFKKYEVFQYGPDPEYMGEDSSVEQSVEDVGLV